MLRIKNVESGYGRLKVLKKVTMHIRAGEIVTIIGANGAGKTSLLKTVSGLIPARSGEILFDMKEIGKLPPEKIVFLGCSLVPEGRQLFAPMTVKENILLGAYPQYRKSAAIRSGRTSNASTGSFPASGSASGSSPARSPGRTADARHREGAHGPPEADHDGRALDGACAAGHQGYFLDRHETPGEGNTVLLVEQNAKAALGIADRGYVLETGRIIMQGTAEDLLSNREVQRAYLGRDLDAEGTM